ncbi:hypothetical protein [Actinomadura sp. WMMB 499]|uniref:hypothetical protein n=1 Tax=Actinomadura sp. WMMB 499 TaxID=1219491 RepID=UPI0012479CCE|nr:hypothetical protein [Actinomadura sp. WMMB 499]QFG22463.1 hypothetical protein F7P10_16355 [Actinomadura sp. WMMB 499]
MSEQDDRPDDPEQRARIRRYSALVFALSVVVVGMCSVVAEALVPRALPPQDARGWASLLLATTLFTMVAVAAALAGFLEGVGRALARRPFGERLVILRGRPLRVTVAAVFFVAVAVAVAQLADLGKLVKDSRLGGLDLAGYCTSYGYTTASADYCRRDIDLPAVCDWQYDAPGHTVRLGPDAYGAICVDPEGRPLEGIDDMAGYCRHILKKSVAVEAAPVNDKTWTCQIEIDRSLACSWRFQKRDLEARKDGHLWTCYE